MRKLVLTGLPTAETARIFAHTQPEPAAEAVGEPSHSTVKILNYGGWPVRR
jgi:hypothetical protein